MSALHENIVREFFESHGFFVRAQRRYLRRGEEEIELLASHPQPKPAPDPAPFVLAPSDVGFMARAVIAIRPWHTDTFSSARLAGTPEHFRFIQPAQLRRWAAAFGTDQPIWKVLVLSTLPAGKAQREEAISFLKGKGIDAVLSFNTVLDHLIETVEVNRNYQKSELLQTIRILKNYALLKDRQLELFKGRQRSQKPVSRPRPSPPGET